MRTKPTKITSVFLSIIMIPMIMLLVSCYDKNETSCTYDQTENHSTVHTEYTTACSITEDDFQYEENEDGVVLTHYSGCASEVSIPSTLGGKPVTEIRTGAFNYNTDITSVTIPDSVTEISLGAFSNCTELRDISFLGDINICSNSFENTAWYNNQPDGVVYLNNIVYTYKGKMPENTSIKLKDGTKGFSYRAFASQTNLKSIELPNTVNSISRSAFEECTGLESITIPDSLAYIDYRAFSGCSSLKSINLSDNIKNIYGGAFSGCSSLESVSIPKEMTTIDSNVFSDCKSIEKIVIPDSVTTINIDAFFGCTNLKEVVISDSVTEIYGSAFQNCTSLEEITIPDSVTMLGYQSLDNTAWYENQPDGMVYIGNIAYKYKGEMPENTSITLKDGTRLIAEGIFSECTNLISVTLPSGIPYISGIAFLNCENLSYINVPDSITQIKYKAFLNCSKLENITIPDSVKEIEYDAFVGCKHLTNLTIPDSVEKFGAHSIGFNPGHDAQIYVNNSDFTMYGYTYSEAQKYADENNIEFISIG